MATAQEFLTQTAVRLKRMTVRLNRLDGSLVENDIAARRIEADIGLAWAKVVDRIEAALKTTRSSQRMDQWVKATCGVEISTMRRRKRLHKHWREYEAKRRELGQCGQSGLKFGLSLVSEQTHTIKTNRAAVPVRSVAKTIPRSAIKRAAARNDPEC
jgi:hypothetical protein